MDSYIDHLPSHEQEKLRKRLRSPEEYERLREKVRGPEDLEREMERNAEFAEARLHLESDPKAKEAAKETVRTFAKENGPESVSEGANEELSQALEQGQFDVVVTEQEGVPTLSISLQNNPSDAPSGNVSETLPLNPALQQQILSTFTLK